MKMHNNAQAPLAGRAQAGSPSLQRFRSLVSDVLHEIAGRRLDGELEQWLNQHHGPSQPAYERLRLACLDGVWDGWMCTRGRGSLRYGRVLEPADDLQRFSVDVVDM